MRQRLRIIECLLLEWKIRIEMYWIHGIKIIMKNKGIIQWDDFSILHRPSWPYYYSIEEMEVFMKDLKDASSDLSGKTGQLK